MKQKKKYVAPELTVVQFHAEVGYAASLESWSASQVANTINDAIAQQALLDEEGNFSAGTMIGSEDHTSDGGSSDWHYMGDGLTWF